jgi:hypothetical protein
MRTTPLNARFACLAYVIEPSAITGGSMPNKPGPPGREGGPHV